MKALEKVQNKFDQIPEKLNDYLDKLAPRERIMVIVMIIFLIVAGIGSALWYMHVAAEKQQKRANDLKDLMVWMQSNVVTMKPASDLALTANDKVQRVAQQQGITVASQQEGQKIQVVASHQNYAVLANFITQMAQMGLSIQKMELAKSEGQIKLTATVQ
ncbi:type II secretion system protein GspM [Acinetobacter stercoris]|uniref:General secretion pathway, M protein n=1 Tax=Acinetobacter stercoris TaxID=2126983 RepID=A0A2U3MVU1_9GAMM|nr:type II secretion system protein GspM [Acinetobacter stercoris]SPL69542.1 General secretion pathway, M protein [Acinetobacter stercoris]